jgi:hypothetical protein
VYVENLPPDTTHESLKAKFLEFGPVAYVSIPKFRNSRRIKAGLEKTRGFKKPASGFFLLFFFFFYILAQKRVFKIFSVSRIQF